MGREWGDENPWRNDGSEGLTAAGSPSLSSYADTRAPAVAGRSAVRENARGPEAMGEPRSCPPPRSWPARRAEIGRAGESARHPAGVFDWRRPSYGERSCGIF